MPPTAAQTHAVTWGISYQLHVGKLPTAWPGHARNCPG